MEYDYSDTLTKVIHEEIDGLGPWLWTKSDSGCWHIISQEWPNLRNMWIKHIDSYNVCIQAGGCCGLYPKLFSEIFGRVYTFEPDPLSFHCLVNNCQSDNIFKYNSALGSENELVSLIRGGYPNNVGENKVNRIENGTIPTLTIDNLALDACDFIQLDVEGYELNALQGASNTIKKYKPVISCENGNDEILIFLNSLAFYMEVGSYGIGDDRKDVVYKSLDL